jgi:hypothetical protein
MAPPLFFIHYNPTLNDHGTDRLNSLPKLFTLTFTFRVNPIGVLPFGVPAMHRPGVIGGIVGSTPVAVPAVESPQRIRVSLGVSQVLLVKKVNPVYPPLARQARIQGTVLLQAHISKDGTVEDLQLISGHQDARARRDRGSKAVGL